MRYLCLGYLDWEKLDGMSEREREEFLKACSQYDDVLRANGHFVRLEGLERAQHAKTLRLRGGKVTVTDGPFAETKEQIGGLLLLEAQDLDQAVRLMAKHPGTRVGTFELRAIDEPSCERTDSSAKS